MSTGMSYIKGALGIISLSELFQHLAASGKQGTLTVTDDESTKIIYFGSNGVILLSTGKRKGLRLGDLLLAAERLRALELSRALERQQRTGQRLGEVLEDMGLMTHEQITEFVIAQLQDELFDLFRWEEASFEFREGEPPSRLYDPDETVSQIALDVRTLLMEAQRRLDEWEEIRQVLANPKAVYSLTGLGLQFHLHKPLDQPTLEVLPLVDGKRTVDDIVRDSKRSRYDVLKLLHHLVQQGYLAEATEEELERQRASLLDAIHGKEAAPAVLEKKARPCVLVADDEFLIRRIIEFQLRKAGYNVIEAADGEETWRILTSRKVDIVLLDLVLPKMDGFEVCKRVRANPALKKLPVIMMSALSSKQYVIEAIRSGGNDYIIKPFRRDIILEKVARHLGAER